VDGDGYVFDSDVDMVSLHYQFNAGDPGTQFPIDSGTLAGSLPGGVSAVPEPASLGLLGMGAIALLGRRRRSR